MAKTVKKAKRELMVKMVVLAIIGLVLVLVPAILFFTGAVRLWTFLSIALCVLIFAGFISLYMAISNFWTYQKLKKESAEVVYEDDDAEDEVEEEEEKPVKRPLTRRAQKEMHDEYDDYCVWLSEQVDTGSAMAKEIESFDSEYEEKRKKGEAAIRFGK